MESNVLICGTALAVLSIAYVRGPLSGDLALKRASEVLQ